MDREDSILVKILSAAKEGTLSKRKWQKYECIIWTPFYYYSSNAVNSRNGNSSDVDCGIEISVNICFLSCLRNSSAES